MKDDINLLGTHEKKPVKKQNYFLIISAGFFGLMFLISIFVLALSFIEKNRLSDVNTSVNNLQAKIDVLSSEKNKLLTIENRLGSIKRIMSSRKPIDTKMQAIVSFIPASFNVNEFSASDIKLSITMTSSSLADFDNFLEVKIPQLTKNKALGINHIDMSSFSTDESLYSMTATFYFTPGK